MKCKVCKGPTTNVAVSPKDVYLTGGRGGVVPIHADCVRAEEAWVKAREAGK
jgi:hypothetical protein